MRVTVSDDNDPTPRHATPHARITTPSALCLQESLLKIYGETYLRAWRGADGAEEYRTRLETCIQELMQGMFFKFF